MAEGEEIGSERRTAPHFENGELLPTLVLGSVDGQGPRSTTVGSHQTTDITPGVGRQRAATRVELQPATPWRSSQRLD